MGCLECGRNLHDLCGLCACCNKPTEEQLDEVVATGVKGRKLKDDESIKDPHSTGRKRAAQLYPLDPAAPCDWQGKINCGGGKHPIIGCIDGKQEERHHGPDKNTLNNAEGNVHRICDNCHNIWHSQNNRDYDPTIAHNPSEATKQQLLQRVIYKKYEVTNVQ